MGPIIHQASYIVFRHLWQLLLKNAFQASQDDEAFSPVVVVDNTEFDLAIALLCYSGLLNLIRTRLSLEKPWRNAHLFGKRNDPRFAIGLWRNRMRVRVLDSLDGTFTA